MGGECLKHPLDRHGQTKRDGAHPVAPRLAGVGDYEGPIRCVRPPPSLHDMTNRECNRWSMTNKEMGMSRMVDK